MFILDSELAKDTFLVAELELCSVLLMNNANFPWLILVPKLKDKFEITDFSFAERNLIFDEVTKVAKIMQEIYNPYKINIATLGNIVRQFHVHVIARYKTDIAWPNVVWGKTEYAKNYDQTQLTQTVNTIKEKFL